MSDAPASNARGQLNGGRTAIRVDNALQAHLGPGSMKRFPAPWHSFYYLCSLCFQRFLIYNNGAAKSAQSDP